MMDAKILEIFKENKNLDLIDQKIEVIEDIDLYINSNQVPMEIKQKIIQKRINKKNILKILKYSYLNLQIEKLKEKELNEAIDELTIEQIKKELKSVISPEIIIKKIYERRKYFVESIIDEMNDDLEKIYCNTKEPHLAHYIYENKHEKLQKFIKNITNNNIFMWITSKNVPDKIKEEIFENKKEIFKDELLKKSTNLIVYDYLNSISSIPDKIKEEIINIKKEKIINEFNGKNIINELKYGSASILLKDLIIQNFINEENLYDTINHLEGEKLLIKKIIENKKEIIEFMLNELNNDEFLSLEKYKLTNNTKSLIINNFKDLIINKLKKIEKNEKIKALLQSNVNDEMKKIILFDLGIKNDLDYMVIILNKYKDSKVIKYYDEVKEKIIKNNINFDIFMQYGSNSQKHPNWFNDLIEINDINKFVEIKNYIFKNIYQKTTKIYEISFFLELLSSYQKLYPLLNQLINEKVILNEDEIVTLKLVLKKQNKEIPNSYEELKQLRYKEYLKIKNKESFEERKKILSTIVNEENIINVEILKKLKQDNKNSAVMLCKIDELISFVQLHELLYSKLYQEGIVNYILEDYEKLKKLQNIFCDYENKIRELFELDIKVNLTKIENMENYIDESLQKKYGGKVINISDKNYVLCAHIKGEKEKIEDLIQGKSNGTSNFISMSPISYKGQKYYYDFKYNGVILAYDKISDGSFICSSLENMGTNIFLTENNLEFDQINRKQRGLLETSAVENTNSEILFYRDGLKPCGIILPKGTEPNFYENEYHIKYGLPFIITQEKEKCIENPKLVFEPNKIEVKKEKLNKIKIENVKKINIQNDIYTGRQIAIFTDCHAMFEPTLAVLETIRKREITEIYSLGDNIGLGPNPCEVIDLLEEYKVKSVAGNSEYYQTLGIEPFSYFDDNKRVNEEWTCEKLGSKYIEKLKLYPSSIDILLGNKKIALCHFINDVRWDYMFNGSYSYQSNFKKGENAKQFLYTNSDESKEELMYIINQYSINDKRVNGLIDSLNNPLFKGKQINSYDDIFQGHVHFEMNDRINNTNIHTLRACGMGKGINNAKAYILKEKKDGTFDVEIINPYFNKTNLICNIKSSSIPNKEKILKFLN